MKTLHKYACGLLLTASLSISFISNANAQRIGFSIGGGFGYRGGLGVSLGFSTGGGFFRPGLGYYGYPHTGFYINALPRGYYSFSIGADQYYYSGGVFYRPFNDGGYVATAPPVGAMVPALPRGTKSIMIDGNQYYTFNGVYYKSVRNDKGEYMYVVAGKDGILNTDSVTATELAPKVGDIVQQLPDDCRQVTLKGKQYQVSADDIYYEEATDNNGNPVYKIAGIPDEDGK